MSKEIEAVKGVGGGEPVAAFPPRLPDPGAGQPEVEGPAKPVSTQNDVGFVFEVARGGRELVIKIVERESRRVLREIPSQEVQRLRATMQAILGVALDRRG
jgi:hypothetical protein